MGKIIGKKVNYMIAVIATLWVTDSPGPLPYQRIKKFKIIFILKDAKVSLVLMF